MSKTIDKILFGMWLVVAIMNIIGYIANLTQGTADIWQFISGLFAIVICTNYWELWHVETPEICVNVMCCVMTYDESKEDE